ncbi:hypothetical protein B0H14DRAFT_2563993 [Mycena olivaceomarginata]|nr:hypothetical protein B0H14DRAFT_2563993 [Mycena olivaceomarginata]
MRKSGKSTLSATVIETLRQKPHTPVAAQFFISHNIPDTVNPSKIIPAIAMQLTEFSSAAAGIIHDVLERGFPPTREKQVKELLLAPIQELSTRNREFAAATGSHPVADQACVASGCGSSIWWLACSVL